MKVRYGFVSNSSSSSFIIGIANATKAGRDDIGVEFDPTKAETNKWSNNQLVDVGANDYSAAIMTQNADGTYKLTISSFMDIGVSCTASPGDKIVALHGFGPDGDDYFSVYNDAGEWIDMDYDNIDLEDFSEKDQEKAKLIESLGGSCHYGAGRNG